MQEICDRLSPGTIAVFVERWLARLPLPFTTKDRDAGYWWETSMRQIEISRTIVFWRPTAFVDTGIIPRTAIPCQILDTSCVQPRTV